MLLSDSSAASAGGDLGWESGLFDRGTWSEAQVRYSALHIGLGASSIPKAFALSSALFLCRR